VLVGWIAGRDVADERLARRARDDQRLRGVAHLEDAAADDDAP
jgi:hypothetical protein